MLVPIPKLQHADHSTVSWIKIAEADQEGDEDRTPMLIHDSYDKGLMCYSRSADGGGY